MRPAIRSLLLATAALALPLGVSAQQTAPNPQIGMALPPQLQAQSQTGQLPAFTHPQSVRMDAARLDAVLNGTGSFSGRFAQYGADGSFATGSVYVQRPGKVRFEYDDPNPLLIVSDGVTLVQHDKALQTYDRVPLSATPLNYFLKEDVNLVEDTEVIGFQKLPTEWRVTSRDGSGQLDGAITLVFDAATLALKQWVIIDEFGGQTTVTLSDLTYNERINPRLFILRDDSDRRGRRR